jgi:predicted transcriptional regulator
MKKLPEAEFAVMNAIWASEPPVTTAQLMRKVGNEKGWKPPALISLLNRLIERGFVSTEKTQKERTYFPLVQREDYLRFETEGFVQQYHGGSLTSLMASLVETRALTEEQLLELEHWVQQRRG